MAGTLKRKLISTVVRPQLSTPQCCSRSPLRRNISQSTPSQTSQTFTFGSEVDALIAPHVAKLSKRAPSTRPQADIRRTATATAAQSIPNYAHDQDSSITVPDTYATDTQPAVLPRRRRPKLSEIPTSHYPSHSNDIPFASPNLSRTTIPDSTKTAPQPQPQTPSPPKARKRSVLKQIGRPEPPTDPRPLWAQQKSALQQKYPTGWSPRRKLSPDAQDGIRSFHAQDPIKYSTSVLAQQFKVSPEAIRRILKSRWMTEEKKEERRARWAKRHDRLWDQRAALGLVPERRKSMGVGGGDEWEEELSRRLILEEARREDGDGDGGEVISVAR